MTGEYLVSHGCAGHLGRFRAVEPGEFERGSAVVVRSCRGLELGELLCPFEADRPVFPDPFVGELLRPATARDHAAADQHRELGRQLFQDGTARADVLGLPLAVVDVEVFLDGRQALLHALRLGPCDEGPLLAELGDRHGLIVRLYDLAAEPDAEYEHGCSSCGSGGCGDGGCGNCGNGCGSCGAGGATELAAYFASLRQQMEQRNRVALL